LLLGVAAALVVVAMTGTDERGADHENPLDRFPGEVAAGTATEAGSAGAPGYDDPSIREFLPFAVQAVEGFWYQQFQRANLPFRHVRVVVFRGSHEGSCGTASPATGPFYCPRDRRLYLELDFFEAVDDEFRPAGDFAQTYVVAHAIAHHVQALTGIKAQARLQVELQADCLAGAWAHSTYERGLLERGVLDDGLRAAAAVGDDRIQRVATGRVGPETWTHGSPAQRRTWFVRGFESGDPAVCDTFSVDSGRARSTRE
jgi:predicted metalloprotease